MLGRLYGFDLPKPTETTRAIKLARNIHYQCNRIRKRKTKLWYWDNYWVQVYDNVLRELKELRKRRREEIK